jgi:hypothetical protein
VNPVSFEFDGQTGGSTKTFNVSIANGFIANKDVTYDAGNADELLLNVTTGTTNVNSATTTVTTGYYVKKPFYLKRTSDKPKPTFIKELSLLLDKLSDKDYIDKPFKKVEKDTDDKVQETDIPKAGSIGTEVDEDHQMRWMGGCC